MEPHFLRDFFFYFFVFVTVVWAYRACRMLHALYVLPKVTLIENSKPVETCEKVTVFIPAKNEESNIAECLDSILQQDHPNFEIIVINDNSTDRTEEIIKSMGAIALNAPIAKNTESKLKYFNNSPTPPHWTGKNFALHSAIPHATGEWFVFTDADTKHVKHCLRSCLEHIKKDKLSFLTLLPHCLTGGFWEAMIQPFAMCYLGLWFPLNKVNNPHSKLYFANGQFLMMSKKTYESIGGHNAVKDQFLEDFALMKRTKENGLKAQVALGKDVYGTRMYSCLKSIRRGWRRILLHAFQKNTARLYLEASSVFFFSLLPFLVYPVTLVRALLWPEAHLGAFYASSLCLLFIMLITGQAYTLVKGKSSMSIFHPVAAFWVVIILIDACGMAIVGKKTKWR